MFHLLNSTYDILLTIAVQMASNVNQESSSTICKKCSKLYTDPRMLPCLHSFCKKCIESLVTQNDSKTVICCVVCETTCPISEKGVEAIPRNVRLSYEAEVAMYEAKIKGTVPTDCEACTRIPSEQASLWSYSYVNKTLSLWVYSYDNTTLSHRPYSEKLHAQDV